MKTEILMTPGPCQIPPEVRAAEALPAMHHRSAEFTEIFKGLAADLKKLLRTESDVFILSSSGTGAMEAAVANVVSPGDKVIVGVTGKFGERFSLMCKAFGANVVEINKEWGQIVTPEEVRAALKREKDARAVFITYNETSSGVVNPIHEIGPAVAETDAVFAVDAVSAFGGLDVRFDEWKLDFLAAGSQKAIMLPAGLAFSAVSAKGWRAAERATSPRFYYDLREYRKSFNEKGQNPFTTPVSLCMGLRASLDMILAEGFDNALARHGRLARACRAGVAAMGLEPFTKHPSDVVTVFRVPAGVDGNELVKRVRERFGIRVSGGQNPFKGKIVRIAHMGYVSERDIIMTLSAVEMALIESGFGVEPGKAVRAAEEVFVSEKA